MTGLYCQLTRKLHSIILWRSSQPFPVHPFPAHALTNSLTGALVGAWGGKCLNSQLYHHHHPTTTTRPIPQQTIWIVLFSLLLTKICYYYTNSHRLTDNYCSEACQVWICSTHLVDCFWFMGKPCMIAKLFLKQI